MVFAGRRSISPELRGRICHARPSEFQPFHGHEGSAPRFSPVKRQVAEKDLDNRCCDVRKEAAATLREHHRIESYSHLLTALRCEEDPDATDAILAALTRIGKENQAEHAAQLREGRAPLMEFIKHHLEDSELVALALDALEFTGTVQEMLAAGAEIMELATRRICEATMGKAAEFNKYIEHKSDPPQTEHR
jgi:hypothetical protein